MSLLKDKTYDGCVLIFFSVHLKFNLTTKPEECIFEHILKCELGLFVFYKTHVHSINSTLLSIDVIYVKNILKLSFLDFQALTSELFSTKYLVNDISSTLV